MCRVISWDKHQRLLWSVWLHKGPWMHECLGIISHVKIDWARGEQCYMKGHGLLCEPFNSWVFFDSTHQWFTEWLTKTMSSLLVKLPTVASNICLCLHYFISSFGCVSSLQCRFICCFFVPLLPFEHIWMPNFSKDFCFSSRLHISQAPKVLSGMACFIQPRQLSLADFLALVF